MNWKVMILQSHVTREWCAKAKCGELFAHTKWLPSQDDAAFEINKRIEELHEQG